jgi:hypothetical protein
MFVSLQQQVRPCDVAALKSRSNLLHFGDDLMNFSDTAALIGNLDLVVSVDTGVAHLAGALAKPVRVMLPLIPDWRWLLDREDSPWYPTACFDRIALALGTTLSAAFTHCRLKRYRLRSSQDRGWPPNAADNCRLRRAVPFVTLARAGHDP